MAAVTITYRPIGIIHSPFEGINNVPIQPAAAQGIRGTIDVFDEFLPGLRDLEGFSHIFLLYHLHLASQTRLIVTPFLDREPRGVFSTRAPTRPNPIGLSIVRLLEIQGATLRVENLDIVDGTPLLDIKPYIPQFDHQSADRTGWFVENRETLKDKRSDERFG